MLISPEVRNAIHVGDRILEINGLPVGTLMEEEVGLSFMNTSETHGVIMVCKILQVKLISSLTEGKYIPRMQFESYFLIKQ